MENGSIWLWVCGLPALVCAIGLGVLFLLNMRPPNVERLKEKKNLVGLVLALDYKKDETIRQAAAEALPKTLNAVIAALGHQEHSRRKAAAQSLVAAYRTGRLPSEYQQRVLRERGRITRGHSDRPHEDRERSSDCETHTDRPRHSDRGAGVQFEV